MNLRLGLFGLCVFLLVLLASNANACFYNCYYPSYPSTYYYVPSAYYSPPVFFAPQFVAPVYYAPLAMPQYRAYYSYSAPVYYSQPVYSYPSYVPSRITVFSRPAYFGATVYY